MFAQKLSVQELRDLGYPELALDQEQENLRKRDSISIDMDPRSPPTRGQASRGDTYFFTSQQASFFKEKPSWIPSFEKMRQGGISDQAMALALNAESQKQELPALESELKKLQGESPETQEKFLKLVEEMAGSFLNRAATPFSDPQDAELIQEKFHGLAAETYGMLARVAAGSVDPEIQKRAALYEGYKKLALGNIDDAKLEFEKIRDEIPEAEERLEFLEKSHLRQINLAAVEAWSTFVAEGKSLEEEQLRSLFGDFRLAGNRLIRGDGTSLDDDLAIRVYVEEKLISQVKGLLLSGECDTVRQALYLLSSVGDTDVKARAWELHRASKIRKTDDDTDLIPRLIEYVENPDSNTSLVRTLCQKAVQWETRYLEYGQAQTSLGIFSILHETSTDPLIQGETASRLEHGHLEKDFGDYVIASIENASPDDLALSVTLMSGAAVVGGMTELVALDKFRQAGQVGWKGIAMARGTGAVAEGTALWALTMGHEALVHDTSRLTPEYLAKSYGATVIMIGSLKTTGTLGQTYAPRVSRALGLVSEEGAKLSAGGRALSWTLSHTAGMGGMVASTQLNEALHLQETPEGGFEESLVHDMVGYVRFAVAHKAVERFSQGTLSKIGRPQHQAIALRQAQMRVEAKLPELGYAIKGRTPTGDPIFENASPLYNQLVSATLTRPGFSSEKLTELIADGQLKEAGAYAQGFGLKLELEGEQPMALREIPFQPRPRHPALHPLLRPMWMLMGTEGPGGSEKNEEAPYRETYKIRYKSKYTKGVLSEITFQGEEWRGVVEKLNRISDLMEEKLEPGQGRGQESPIKKELHELLRDVDEYSPESFFFALEVFEGALIKGIPFDHTVLNASIAKRNLDCFLGETPKPDPEWERYLENLAGQLSALAPTLRGKFMADRRAFYKAFNETVDRASYSSFPNEIRENISRKLRDILLLPGIEAAKEQLQALAKSAALTATPERLLKVSSRERRPVVWNPLARPGDRSYILHPSLGEGWIVSEEEPSRLKVKFPEKEAVIVLESVIARPEEKEKYEKILIDRTIRFSHLPYNYVPLVLVHYLSHEEATSVRNRLHGRSVPPLDLSGDPIHPGSVASDIHVRLKKNIASSSSKQIGWLTEEANKFAKKSAGKLGIDPIIFVLRLMVGEYPSEAFNPNYRRSNLDKMFGDRIMTPDLIRGFLQTRPWMENWVQEGIFKDSPVETAGYYYPSLYKGSDRPCDLTELYFAFREGDENAFGEVKHLMQKPIQEWALHRQHEAPVVLVPMIGQAPLEKLAREYDLPVSFPWRPRPANYGEGVEGQRTSVKMDMVQQALKLDLDKLQEVQGKSVLLLDDNLTDGVTYIHARKLLLDAGAKEIRLMLLTRTIRTPAELSWETAPPEHL